MPNVPSSPEDVKWIISFYELRGHRCCQFLENNDGLHPLPYRVFRILPPDLLHWKDEPHGDEAVLHSYGFWYYRNGDNGVLVPIKDFDPITSINDRPLEVAVTILDAPANPQKYGHGFIPVIVRFDRPAEPEDFNPRLFRQWKTDQAAQYLEYPRPDPDNQVERPGQEPARHLHVVPPTSGVAKAPEPEKPTPTEGRRSVGLTRKFAYIPGKLMELMEADRLSMLEIEVYRILYTFRQYPEKSRIREEGKGPAYPLPYAITYQSQIVENLKARKTDLVATARGERRNQARKMGTSLRSVQYAIARLWGLGWVGRVYRGLPEHCDWLSPQQQERRIQRHERVPQWGPQKYILATDKCQRDLMKGFNRKLKELGLPPYLINLPGPRF
ncbi:hypothetical protein ES703_29955 [subsurface metagenome]